MRFLSFPRKCMTGLVVIGLLFLCCCAPEEVRQVNVIPLPADMTLTGGVCKIDSALLFSGQSSSKLKIQMEDRAEAGNPEAYRLEVTKGEIRLQASAQIGVFYGMQTLCQLYAHGGVPCVTIEDAPRFGYRGLHLDVSRHFFPKEEVMNLLDVMSQYKLNRLHLHLTDAGGWRFEVDKYPKLTAETAFRTESDWRKWWNGKDRRYLPEGTPGAYGGYFTKQDIREIVAYAADRYIEVVPEIEFPGHSEEVLTAYPELSCSGKPYVNGDFCIGNEQSFIFMEDVLAEVIELFPSKYIHVGGDETGKKAWKSCPKCQALMKKEGMKNVDELQNYMIHRTEAFLLSKGRQLIGWDEILQGGLAPEATVMSWRGEEGGIRAARMGHDVVMTPGNYMYFDFYQADPKTQPYAIGGYTPVKKVYSYNPLPVDSLTEEEQKHILGVQGNTWTEYIQTPEHLEYMMFPRALAVAEIGWTPQDLRTWDGFKPRLNAHISRLQAMGINCFTLSDELEATMQVDTVGRQITVTLDSEKCPAEIRYTTDGSMPTASSALYEAPIVVKDSAHIVAAIFRDGTLQGIPTEKVVDYHRGINRPIHYYNRLYSGYMAGGMNALLDGYRGGLTYLDGRWQGYLDNLDCAIDMGETTDLHKVSVHFMQLIGPGVFQPRQVELLLSDDGEHFTSCGVIPTTIASDNPDLSFQTYTFQGAWTARYVRVKAARMQGGFIFADEIVIW